MSFKVPSFVPVERVTKPLDKVAAIIMLRNLASLTLKEAKDWIDENPHALDAHEFPELVRFVMSRDKS